MRKVEIAIKANHAILYSIKMIRNEPAKYSGLIQDLMNDLEDTYKTILNLIKRCLNAWYKVITSTKFAWKVASFVILVSIISFSFDSSESNVTGEVKLSLEQNLEKIKAFSSERPNDPRGWFTKSINLIIDIFGIIPLSIILSTSLIAYFSRKSLVKQRQPTPAFRKVEASIKGIISKITLFYMSPEQIIAMISATGTVVDIFDKIAGQVKSVLQKKPKEAEGDDERWRNRIKTDNDKLVVTQNIQVVQTITAAQLANLPDEYLGMVKTYEKKMKTNLKLWQAVYVKKDLSPDPLVNAQIDLQLEDLIQRMKVDLTNIIDFLQKLGLSLDDHYLEVRYLVEKA